MKITARTRVRRGLHALALAAFTFVASACDDPSGPGTLALDVTWETTSTAELGAVVMRVTGPGVTGISSSDGAWVVTHPIQTVGSTGLRVVVLQEVPGAMRLQVEVQDVGGPAPTVVVEEASDDADRTIYDLGNIRTQIGR